MIFKTCSRCGCTLDPGEACDCEREVFSEKNDVSSGFLRTETSREAASSVPEEPGADGQ